MKSAKPKLKINRGTYGIKLRRFTQTYLISRQGSLTTKCTKARRNDKDLIINHRYLGHKLHRLRGIFTGFVSSTSSVFKARLLHTCLPSVTGAFYNAPFFKPGKKWVFINRGTYGIKLRRFSPIYNQREIREQGGFSPALCSRQNLLAKQALSQVIAFDHKAKEMAFL